MARSTPRSTSAGRPWPLADRTGADTFGTGRAHAGQRLLLRRRHGGPEAAVERLIAGARSPATTPASPTPDYMRSLAETRSRRRDAGTDHAAAPQRRRRAAATRPRGRRRRTPPASGRWRRTRHAPGARCERSEALAREVGNRWFELFARTEALWLRAADGDPWAALADLADVLEAWHRAGDWANQWLSLRHVFGICSQVGADDLAMIIHGALDHAGAVDAFPFEPGAAAELATTVEALRDRLGDRIVALQQQGRSGTTSSVIGLIVDRIAS